MTDVVGAIIARGYIVGVRVQKSVEPDHTMRLELDFEPSLTPTNSRESLAFDGVADLKIGDLNSYSFSLLGVDDIRNSGLESVRYSVRDAEGEIISFKCSDWRVIC